MGPIRPHFRFMATHPMKKISSVSAMKFRLFCSPINAPVCMFPKDQWTSQDSHGLRCAEKVIQETPRAISLLIHVPFVPGKAPACTYTIRHIFFTTLRSFSYAGSVLCLAHKSAVTSYFS